MLKKAIKKGGIVIIFSLVFFFLFLSPHFLFAQERKLEIEYPEIFGLKPETIKTSLPQYANYIFNLAVMIVGLILFAVFVWAGILYLTSADNVAKLAEAKERMTSAFLGAVFLLSAYIILITINPQLVIFELPFLEKKEPPTYQPPEYKPEEMTQIFWEIPLGQMLEKGLWEKEKTNKLKNLLTVFEQFLEQEITTVSPPIKGLADLNRYLRTLTEECHCSELEGYCQKPKNFSFPIGCVGDPCQKVRDKMNNVLKINREKAKELSAFKEKLIEFKNLFEEEGRKYRKLTEDILEKCKSRGLMTRAEYYESVALIEEQGGKTKLERLYLPTEDDPLVFYCAVGGTIFDYPYSPEQIPLEELKRTEEIVPEPVEAEPLSCPVVIPTGELIEQITAASYETNIGLEELIYYIDKILAELTKMTELVSQCNESHCDISCSCVYNFCFGNCGFPPCLPFCKSPCLQTVGGCYGEPCSREGIIETVERIRIYEEEILGKGGKDLGLLAKIKGSIEDAQRLLKTKEKDKIDLSVIRGDIQTCLSLAAGTASPEKPKEEPFWMLLGCGLTIGNKGSDGNIITGCYPQNFYCCTNKPPAVLPFSSAAQKARPPVYIPPPEGSYSPSSFGFNNVPYFSQYDEKWRGKSFGCGKTVGEAGSGPTSMAMVLNFFGIKTDPPSIADWILKNDYRSCGVGTKWEFCCKAVEAFGKEADLKCKELNEDIKAVLAELKDGKDKVAIISSEGVPPYPKGGHYLVLTGIEKEWDEEFVYYNDPAYDPWRPERRPAQGKKPVDWFEKMGIGAGCVIYK